MADIQKRFLIWHEDTDSFTLVGYPLPLSPKEKLILHAIIFADNDGISKNDLCARLEGSVSPSSIPVHITSINKMALAVGGRYIILNINGYYIITTYM